MSESSLMRETKTNDKFSTLRHWMLEFCGRPWLNLLFVIRGLEMDPECVFQVSVPIFIGFPKWKTRTKNSKHICWQGAFAHTSWRNGPLLGAILAKITPNVLQRGYPCEMKSRGPLGCGNFSSRTRLFSNSPGNTPLAKRWRRPTVAMTSFCRIFRGNWGPMCQSHLWKVPYTGF